MNSLALSGLVAASLATLAGPYNDDDESPPSMAPEFLSAMPWRNIGPANMGGRVTDLAVHPEKSRIYYVASATGGLFKTTNGGVTMRPVFDSEGSSSIGAVALAPSAPDVVWVGTGESNARNSVSWGDGVYSSSDGGATWTHRGLSETRHIGAIVIHPTDPSTVYIAAMGRTWGENEERGLFRTRDGGESWEKVLYVDDATGCIDVVLDPSRPDVLIAATYERQRDEFDSNDPAKRTGPGSGLWRSVDAGDSWVRLEDGLPTAAMGRIGLDIYGRDPRVVYALIETERTGERGAPPRSEDRVSLGIRGRDAGGFVVDSVTDGESAAQAGLQSGDVITRVDDTEIDGRSALVSALKGYAPGQSAELVYTREGSEETATLTLLGRLQRSQGRSFAGSLGGQVANAQDAQGPDGFESGGLFRSDDRGTTWTRINSYNPRPFYFSQVRVDPLDESRLYILGISLSRSTDGGKTFDVVARDVHADHHAMWIDPTDTEHVLLGCDGGVYVTRDDATTWRHIDTLAISQFYNVAVDNRVPYNVYGGLQDNGTWGGPSATRIRGIPKSKWIKINGGDGFHCAVDPTDPNVIYCESQNGSIMRRNISTGEQIRITRGGGDVRFNWSTPFLLSPHNSSLFFYAGSVVFRSIDGGANSQKISDVITRTDRGSATALAQSPVDERLLLVGTDDGALWLTRDAGREWTSIFDRLPGLDGPRYISDIEPSKHRADTIYITVDGHRSNDESAHVFVSDDAGESWTRIVEGLPDVPVRTIAIDPVNPRLLFVGTEFGCFVSIDAGGHWSPFDSGLPTVPVHELVIHPKEADLVAATHGRGIWIADIAPLQSISERLLSSGPHLFPVQDVRRWTRAIGQEFSGAPPYLGDNPATGAAVYYYLPDSQDSGVRLTVRDALGRRVSTLEGPGERGIHLVRWNMLSQARGTRRGGFGRGRQNEVEVGDYSVTLELDLESEDNPVRRIRVIPDPSVAGGASPAARR